MRFPAQHAERVALLRQYVSSSGRGLPTDFVYGQYVGLALLAFSHRCQRYRLAEVLAIDLTHHKATTLPPLSTMSLFFPKLLSLDLSDNSLTYASFEPLPEKLPLLQKVVLRRCELESLEQIIYLNGLKNLKELDLRENPLPLQDNRLGQLETLLSTDPTEPSLEVVELTRGFPQRKGSSKGRQEVAIKMGLYCNIDAKNYDQSSHLGTRWTKVESIPESRSKRALSLRRVVSSARKQRASASRQSLSPRNRHTLKRFDSILLPPLPVPRRQGRFRLLEIFNGQPVTMQCLMNAGLGQLAEGIGEGGEQDPQFQGNSRTLEEAFSFLTQKKAGRTSLQTQVKERHATLKRRIDRMNRQLVLHAFPELEGSPSPRNKESSPSTHSKRSSTIVIHTQNFHRSLNQLLKRPSPRKNSPRITLQHKKPERRATGMAVSWTLTPREAQEEMSHFTPRKQFIEAPHAIGTARLAHRVAESFIKVEPEQPEIATEEYVSVLTGGAKVEEDDEPQSAPPFGQQKKSNVSNTTESAREFVLTNPKLVQAQNNSLGRRGSRNLFNRARPSRKSPAQLIEQMEASIEGVVKPLLERNEILLQHVPSESSGKRDAGVGAMTPMTPDQDRRGMRSSPEIRELRKTKTILQKTKMVDFYQNAKSQAIITYEAPKKEQEEEDEQRYLKYRVKQEKRVMDYLFERKAEGCSEKASGSKLTNSLVTAFKRDKQWLVPTLSRHLMEFKEAVQAEWPATRKKEKSGGGGAGEKGRNLCRLQTREDFARSLERRQAAVDSLRQRIEMRRGR